MDKYTCHNQNTSQNTPRQPLTATFLVNRSRTVPRGACVGSRAPCPPFVPIPWRAPPVARRGTCRPGATVTRPVGRSRPSPTVAQTRPGVALDEDREPVRDALGRTPSPASRPRSPARSAPAAFATPAAAPNTALPPGSAPVATRFGVPSGLLTAPTGLDQALMPRSTGDQPPMWSAQPRSAALRQPVSAHRCSGQGVIDARPAFMARRVALEPRPEPARGPPPARHAACQPPAPTAQGPPAMPRAPRSVPGGRPPAGDP